jgi:hypothetical protein
MAHFFCFYFFLSGLDFPIQLIKDVADSPSRRINFIHEWFPSIIAHIAFMTHFNQMVLKSHPIRVIV